MRPLVLSALWSGAFWWLAACAQTTSPPEPELWDNPGVPLPQADFFDRRPWLRDVSSWSAPGCGLGQPREPRLMGDFGVGNGHVFALSGYACPLNTLHTMIGPVYQKDSGFFEDTWVTVEVSGEEPRVKEGRMFRVRKTDVLISDERSAVLQMFTITFAPRGRDADPVNRSMVRVVVLKNVSEETLPAVRLRIHNGPGVRDDRRRSVLFLEPAVGDEQVILGELAPGRERTAVLAYVISRNDGDADETVAGLRAAGWEALLEETRDDWRAFFEGAAHLESPDPRVDDYYHGMLVTVRSQQTALGAIGVMSQYTGMWLRNMAGPARFLCRVGLFEDVRAMLEYYHLAARVEGDVRNSVRLDHDPQTVPPEPDWESLGPLSGREEAESPSNLPLMAYWYTLASGSTGLLRDQYGLLERAIDGQVMDEDYLLPFSGDETFRTAMSIASGLPLDHDYKSCCKSANSSFMFVAAAEALANLSDDPYDAANLRDEAARVREAAENTYFTPEGYYAPYIEPGVDGFPEVYEDVATKPLWTGYAKPDDERALSSLEYLVGYAGRDDGFLVSPLHPVYDGALDLDVHEGVYTGMNPGYALFNLAMTDHPLAEDSFNAVRLAASYSGNAAEYQIYDDHSALQIVYDYSGTLGDYTARYMNWEGSVTADALVFYLTGFESYGAYAVLAPRLPNSWPQMKWGGLRVGDTRFDLLVEDPGGKRRVAVTTASGGFLLRLSLPLGTVEVRKVLVDGERLSEHDYQLRDLFGQVRVELLEAFEIGKTRPLEAEVFYGGQD
jgi:hypothetical protein